MECSICYKTLLPEFTKTLEICKHEFHETCTLRSNEFVCPLCRNVEFNVLKSDTYAQAWVIERQLTLLGTPNPDEDGGPFPLYWHCSACRKQKPYQTITDDRCATCNITNAPRALVYWNTNNDKWFIIPPDDDLLYIVPPHF